MKALISKPEELTPQTTWQETKWAWTSEEELVDHTTKGRLCAAALLPFRDRQPDWEGFVASIRWMQAAADHYGVELVTVLNADTGYIFDLDDAMYAEVLRRFRGEFPMAARMSEALRRARRVGERMGFLLRSIDREGSFALLGQALKRVAKPSSKARPRKFPHRL